MRISCMIEKERNERKRKYGTGKHPVHKRYVKYMEEIVSHENYQDIPNAKDSKGHINWQVSSGKTTSFYKDYIARKKWWIKKSDELELEGNGGSNARFSICARIIHPTKIRPCRLCGQFKNVGYYYPNKIFCRKISKLINDEISYGESIDKILEKIFKKMTEDEIKKFLKKFFPEREFKDNSLKSIKNNFLDSIHIRSNWLSPGFMANPPDRLDGFHDYCIDCRSKKDPGRSKENLKSYLHDRRAFSFWSEGNWNVADKLYNSAGIGNCIICGKKTQISPDHLGPLSCGFKQLPLFNPFCLGCNASKNRRFTVKDIQKLIKFEEEKGENVASRQIQSCWNFLKKKIKNDEQAKEFSDLLRGIEDEYLRILSLLKKHGLVRFMVSLLNPEFAHQEIVFEGLDKSTLKFSEIFIKNKKSRGSQSLESRIIRIAVDELDEYAKKPKIKRKIKKISDYENRVEEILEEIKCLELNEYEKKWNNVFTSKYNEEEKDEEIQKLIKMEGFEKMGKRYKKLLEKIIDYFNSIGLAESKEFLK